MRYPILLSFIALLMSVLSLQLATRISFEAKKKISMIKPSHKSSSSKMAIDGQNIEMNNAMQIPKHSIDDYKAILERPIFFAGRRFPPSQPVKPKESKLASRTALRQTPVKSSVSPSFSGKVYGIFISDQAQKVLLSRSDGELEWLQLNDKVDGWTIEKIKSGSVILSQSGFTKQLNLYSTP